MSRPSTSHRVIRILWASLLLLVVGACSAAVIKTSLVTSGDRSAGCSNGHAAYYLPARLLQITLKAGVLEVGYTTATRSGTTVPDIVATADRSRGPFCLGYEGSIFAADKVKVDVDPETSLLQSIAFNADDQTVDVALQLINALADAAAAITAQRAAEENDKLLLEAGPFFVDPFDLSTMSQINLRLADAGYCVFLDAKDDPFVPPASNHMCEQTGYPQVVRAAGVAQAIDGSVDLTRFQGQGVLYRPLLSHKMVVMRKAGRAWELAESRYFELPNASPAFLLRIDRAWIGDSKAVISFDAGTPYDIQLSKQSEFNAVVEIPGAAIRAALSVPINARAYKKAQYENQIRLIQANALLLDNLAKFDATVNADQAGRSGIAPVGPTDSQSPTVNATMDECLDNAFVTTLPSPDVTCAAIIENRL